MTTVEEAVELLIGAVVPLEGEEVPTVEAIGRVLGEPVKALHPLPEFDQSSVDGYAVRHVDIMDSPVELPVALTIAAGGQVSTPELAEGCAARIFTGALLPTGADTVIRQELTTRTGDVVRVQQSVEPGTDIRWRGEELGSGTVVASQGTVVTAGLVGSLIHAGVSTVSVARRPRVALFVTGDEVVDSGQERLHGQIPDSNGPLAAAALGQWHVDLIEVGHIADRRDATSATLDRAMAEADLVITTGGVSVGDFDFVPSAAAQIGCEQVLWKVGQRPGGPLYVARRGNALLVGLPGNPAAVLVNLHVYVRLILDMFAGVDPLQRWLVGRAADEIETLPDKVLWTRCVAHVDEVGSVLLSPLPRQGSHMLSNLAVANAVVRVPMSSASVAKGTTLSWVSLDS